MFTTYKQLFHLNISIEKLRFLLLNTSNIQPMNYKTIRRMADILYRTARHIYYYRDPINCLQKFQLIPLKPLPLQVHNFSNITQQFTGFVKN